MSDLATLTTTSEYAQLVITEAVHTAMTQGAAQPQLAAVIAEALAEDRVEVATLITQVAMAAAGALSVVATGLAVSPAVVLSDFLDGFTQAQDRLAPAVAALAEP